MSKKYPTYESKINALMERDPEAEGEFIYCVLSTSICCRPTCSSRLPLKKNIIFCDNVKEAIEKSFRPCRRCKPDIPIGWNKARESIEKACLIIMKIATSKMKLNVNALACKIHMSKWHFCRTFKNYTGYTPKQYYKECIQGLNPLVLKPLPLIQTKKYLKKQKDESDFRKKVLDGDKVGCNLNDYDYFLPTQTGLQYITPCDNHLEMSESLKEINELNQFHSCLENNSGSAGGDMLISDELLGYMNF